MEIFPMGTVSAASNSGAIDGISYGMFEPNNGCSGKKSYNILMTTFQKKFLSTRKKSEPNYAITYRYNSIFYREFNQIDHFIADHDETLTSFWAVDFSSGLTPTNVAGAGDWVVDINNTRLFSTVANYKAHKAFLWAGTSSGAWKEGDVTSISTNTSITVDVDTNNYGALSVGVADSKAMVYPMYEVHVSPNAVSNFREGGYIPQNVNTGEDGGFMKSGNISFICKYKV